MIKGKSFVGQDTPRLIDTEYRECNFLVKNPLEVGGLKVGVRLFPDDNTPRTFVNCNLINRVVPPNSVIIGGNTAIIDYDITTSVDSVEIDSLIIEIENKSDFCYGKYNPETLEAEYRDTVDEIKQERSV